MSLPATLGADVSVGSSVFLNRQPHNRWSALCVKSFSDKRARESTVVVPSADLRELDWHSMSLPATLGADVSVGSSVFLNRPPHNRWSALCVK